MTTLPKYGLTLPDDEGIAVSIDLEPMQERAVVSIHITEDSDNKYLSITPEDARTLATYLNEIAAVGDRLLAALEPDTMVITTAKLVKVEYEDGCIQQVES